MKAFRFFLFYVNATEALKKNLNFYAGGIIMYLELQYVLFGATLCLLVAKGMKHRNTTQKFVYTAVCYFLCGADIYFTLKKKLIIFKK